MRLKDIVTLRNIKTDRTDLPYIALENIVSWEGTFIPSEIQTEGTNARYFAGDVLFGKLRPYLAKAFIPDNDGICSTEFLVMKTKEKLNNKFLEYYLLSPDFIHYIKNQVAGVKMPRTNWTEIGNLSVSFPEREKQEAIVAYLDKQINSINERICLRERELQTLIKLKQSEINSVVTRGLNPAVPMKDSGIDWIGQIPESWKLKRVKDICDFVSRGCTPDYVDEESDFMVMNQATFSKGYVDYSGVRYSSYCKKEAKINKGDLLIASTGGGVLGKVLLYTDDCDKFYADTHVTIVRNTSTPIIAKYLYYYFSTRFEMINALMAKGSTNQTELQRDELLSHFVPAPGIQEMEAICKHLDDRMAHLSSLIANINAQIDKLKLLKKALINEVVTGQRPITQ